MKIGKAADGILLGKKASGILIQLVHLNPDLTVIHTSVDSEQIFLQP
jgi:hypothetical protein